MLVQLIPNTDRMLTCLHPSTPALQGPTDIRASDDSNYLLAGFWHHHAVMGLHCQK